MSSLTDSKGALRGPVAGLRVKSTYKTSTDKTSRGRYKKSADGRIGKKGNKNILQGATNLADLNAQLAHHQLRLVEKLLDIHVRDVLSAAFMNLRRKERNGVLNMFFPVTSFALNEQEEATAARMSALAGVGVSQFEGAVRERLRGEYCADAADAVQRWFALPRREEFVFVLLRRLASLTREEARRDVRDAVARFIDPTVEAFWRQKRLQRAAAGYKSGSDGLRSVQEAIERAITQKKMELEKHRAARAELQAAGRAHRVQTALAMLKKDVGDLSCLCHVKPVCYVGNQETLSYCERREKKKEELEELRRLRAIVRQQSMQERDLQQQLAKTRAQIEERLKVLRDEVEDAREMICGVRLDLAEKENELRELQRDIAACTIEGDGNAKNVFLKEATAEQRVTMEYKIMEAVKEEKQLRVMCEELRHHLRSLTAEEDMLKTELFKEEKELTATLMEKEKLTNSLRLALKNARDTVLHLRRQQNNVIKELNEMREAMLCGRSREVASRKLLRASMLETAAQLTLENLLQTRLLAQKQWQLQRLRDVYREKAPQPSNASSMFSKMHDVDSFEQVVRLVREVALYRSADSDNATAQLLQEQPTLCISDQVGQLHDACVRLRAEIADIMSNDEKALATAQLRYEKVQRKLIQWQLREEALVVAGVQSIRDAAAKASMIFPFIVPPITTFIHEGELLYAAVSHMLHSETRCRAIIQLLECYNTQRLRGESVKKLCFSFFGPKKSPRVSSRIATTHTALETAANISELSVSIPVCPAAGTQNASMAEFATWPYLTDDATYRKMVLQFIKNELQPLYDTNQVSRARFVDVVRRVLQWFLSTHTSPRPILAENEQRLICDQIQLTLAWQDRQGTEKPSV